MSEENTTPPKPLPANLEATLWMDIYLVAAEKEKALPERDADAAVRNFRKAGLLFGWEPEGEDVEQWSTLPSGGLDD